MPYWGKVIGTLGGLATGRPWMAIIGLLLGHQFDRGFADRFSRFGPDVSASRLERLPQPYQRALFEIMGHLAKADGRVSVDMGVPECEPARIPFRASRRQELYTLDLGGETVRLGVVSLDLEGTPEMSYGVVLLA
jgi:DnaJ like chaperone protein